MTQDNKSSAPVSVDFISSLIADIAALEPQDCAQAVAAFDNFELEELESFKSNMRKITNWLSTYKKKANGYKAPGQVIRDEKVLEKRRQKKLLLTGKEIAQPVNLCDGA